MLASYTRPPPSWREFPEAIVVRRQAGWLWPRRSVAVGGKGPLPFPLPLNLNLHHPRRLRLRSRLRLSPFHLPFVPSCPLCEANRTGLDQSQLGLNHPTQGCPATATLGKQSKRINPAGVASILEPPTTPMTAPIASGTRSSQPLHSLGHRSPLG